MKITIGVSDMQLSKTPGDTLVTHALGSCIGIAIYDSIAMVGGILHYMLPFSKLDNDKADANPYMFGDSGIPQFFIESYKLGAKKENIRVVIAGGAEIIDKCDFFNIGNRNIAIARKMFWKNGIMITAEQTGGNIPRTMYLEIDSGKAWIATAGNRTDLM
jgi:chemotaxis protein CheD